MQAGRAARAVLAAVHIGLGVLLLLTSPLLFFMSIFLFDSPTAAQNPKLMTLVSASWSAPVAAVVAIVAGIVAFARKRSRVAPWLAVAAIWGWAAFFAFAYLQL